MNAKTVELHLLQSFPPSCVNLDGNNSPKDCMFGDARRARISSQCLKRAIRQADSFAETVGEAIADRTVDAAAQVAHAISTHKLSQEMDYWTAADDLKDRSEGEDAGAGMLGTAEFNASLFYRCACINLDQLGRNLGEKSRNGEWPS